MSKVFLPTLDYLPRRGGVARYLLAIKNTFPDVVDVLFWKNNPSRIKMFFDILDGAKAHDQIWTSHILPVGTIIWLTKSIHKKPYVVILHGLDFDLAIRNPWKRWITRRILRGAKNIVTNSRALAREVIDFASVSELIVVNPSLDDDLIKASPADLSMKTKTETADHVITLLSVGRLIERKGHLKVLEAIKDLPNVHYCIVGDGIFKSRIEDKITELGLEERCVISANVTDRELPAFYNSADIFIMPTTKTKLDREGFGIVYLEAELFELPVIATNYPGIDEAIIDKVTGFLVDNSVSEIRFAIEKLVADAELRRRMGKAGRKFVLAGFTREKQFRKLEDLL
ncbi:MAG: glycosyltransferase family 4 protein [Candidatus Uhrbacteria bacterium]|nr:glycosyltransferase family 4 protein [Candidatus Uhrbacteria bacterium]